MVRLKSTAERASATATPVKLLLRVLQRLPQLLQLLPLLALLGQTAKYTPQRAHHYLPSSSHRQRRVSALAHSHHAESSGCHGISTRPPSEVVGLAWDWHTRTSRRRGTIIGLAHVHLPKSVAYHRAATAPPHQTNHCRGCGVVQGYAIQKWVIVSAAQSPSVST